jgi:hypothetical protein
MSRSHPKKIKERFISPASLSTSTSLARLPVLCLISGSVVFKDKSQGCSLLTETSGFNVLETESARTSFVRTDLFASVRNLIRKGKFYASIVELTFFGVVGSNRLCVAISLRD